MLRHPGGSPRHHRSSSRIWAGLVLATAALLIAASLAITDRSSVASAGEARSHLKHLVFIVRENRSFDHYFGTYPGADGIPMLAGVPTVCAPDPSLGRQCVKPYHDPSLTNAGGPHADQDAAMDVEGGRWTGSSEPSGSGPARSASSSLSTPAARTRKARAAHRRSPT